MITDPIEINQRYVKLPEVVVLGIDDPEDGPFRAHLELARTPQGCPLCGVLAHVKDRDELELVDLPLYGHPTRLVWRKRRLRGRTPLSEGFVDRAGPTRRLHEPADDRPPRTVDDPPGRQGSSTRL